MEGIFYSLFEKLRNHDSKFYNYFLVSIHTFDFLVDRVTNSVLLFFLILVKLFFQKYINFSPSLCFSILFLKQSAVLSHKQGLLSTSSIKVMTSYLNKVHILTTKITKTEKIFSVLRNERDWFKPGKDCQNNQQVTVTGSSLPACERAH